ncbi:hypothetical protein C8A05DRAFT_41263 [Staphylotrichum tortipilum]|uniref:Aminoglycoside phosphotransferase domain-containing protein n=1 Tax=Staphylotrichum tortipilum TaxID=2831512 RepID=A0AAN6MUH3_9PEZI|nr:hypothetical protein C8A05DRAFT_41263 [Staphylotrichum longicolle]
MEQTIAALTSYQLKNFFYVPGCPAQEQCDKYATELTKRPSRPDFIHHVEKTYEGFVPWHTAAGRLGSLHVYTMRNVGGVSMYLARSSLHENGCSLLRWTLTDFARFFASAWHNTPEALPLPDRESLCVDYTSDLTQLLNGLPTRFRPVLSGLISRPPDLVLTDWALVPNHIDLLENNIHVDPREGGRLTGVVGPFGMSIGEVENLLGVARTGFSHEYHANHRELRALFFEELHRCVWLGSSVATAADKQHLGDASLIGLFLANGCRYEGGTRAPAREEDPADDLPEGHT